MTDMFPVLATQKLMAPILCAIVAAVDPTMGFVVAIILAGFFNIWCGMRSDGVTIINCKSFSWRKFVRALAEMFMFLAIIEVVALICHSMGDHDVKVYACKTVGYCIVYCYVDNGLKNLCKAYPRSRGLWLIYLFVHLDFRRLIKIDSLMNMYDYHTNKLDKNGDNGENTKGGNA